MAVTEARTQYLTILSQPHWCAAVWGRIILRSRPDYSAGQCGAIAPFPRSDNMLLCFVPYVQERLLHTGWLTAGYCDWRIQSRPACGSTVTHVVPLYFDMCAYCKMFVTGVQKANKNEQKTRRLHLSPTYQVIPSALGKLNPLD